MYETHFGFSERPFSIAPDPRYLYMSRRHREALAHLLYSVQEGGGFVQLSGEVGTGKTTVCRSFLQMVPENTDVALILNPRITQQELLQLLCDELGVKYPAGTSSFKAIIDRLNKHLLASHAAGRRTLLVVDEAQNLSVKVLELIRLLTNLETDSGKLLQIILIGQPELIELLERHDLRQLAQRITARYHLEPLSSDEVGEYIAHRIKVAGGAADPSLFTPGAQKALHARAGGVPRLVNVIADRALLGAWTAGDRRVDARTVRAAADEVLQAREHGPRPPLPRWQIALGAVAVVMMLAVFGWLLGREPPAPAPAAAGAVGEPVTPPDSSEAAPIPIARVPLTQLLEARAPQEPGPAMTRLLGYWGVSSAAVSASCRDVGQYGLACLRDGGTLASLARLDRPALLTLADARGRHYYVVLAALDGERLELDLDGRREVFSRDELDPVWFGRFLLLWRRPPAMRDLISPGGSGADVDWLREVLHRLGREPGEAGTGLAFDSRLKQRVMDFQRERGIVQDGIVGAETVIHLNSLLHGRDIPHLAPVPEPG
ncbi:MAG: AAA family ATPase [Gammaproteobacteria bacterium]|nr:AAA family ATPase [Gammaproteobacteria bacterium]